MSIKKNKKGMLALVLVPFVAVNFYVGGRMFFKKNVHTTTTSDVGKVENVLEMPDKNSYVEVTDEGNSLAKETEEEKIEEVFQESVFDNLSSEFINSGRSILEILNSSTDVNSKLYVSALYEKLKVSGLTDEEIREQLNNILAFSLYPTDFTNEEWEELFGKLNRTVDKYDNSFEIYYPLARYVHENECDLEHREVDFDSNKIECDNLTNLSNEMVKKVSYSDFVIRAVYASEDEDLINLLNRLLYSGTNFDEVLVELQTMYVMAQVPSCVPEDVWYSSFSNLLKTVGEYDNIFEVYGKLATYVHILDCNLEHYLNEFDVVSCDNVKKLYK